MKERFPKNEPILYNRNPDHDFPLPPGTAKFVKEQKLKREAKAKEAAAEAVKKQRFEQFEAEVDADLARRNIAEQQEYERTQLNYGEYPPD